jgi:hypothetical protein
VVSAGYGGGFALGQPVIGTLVGAVFAVGFVAATVTRMRRQNLEAPEGMVL